METLKVPEVNTIKLNRIITILLGLLWLIDGILQFQPAMFTKTFVSQVLSVNSQGQPLFIPAIINFGIHIASLNYFLTNMGSAIIQVIIGLALIFPLPKQYQRIALYASIVWALVVWAFGEGFGNIFTGMASFYTGAPGSVILYLILAVFLLYPKRFSLYSLPKVAGALFLLGAILNLFPMFWTKSGFTQMLFQMSTNDSLSWISSPAKLLTNILASSPVFSNVALVLLLAFFGIKLFIKPGKVIAWSIVIFSVLVWWFAQDLGGVQTFPGGTATDPNSALLYILFLLPLFYVKDWNIKVAKQHNKESLVTTKA
jgi:hypothetical protein